MLYLYSTPLNCVQTWHVRDNQYFVRRRGHILLTDTNKKDRHLKILFSRIMGVRTDPLIHTGEVK